MWSIVGVRDDKLQTRNVRGEVARLALALPPFGGVPAARMGDKNPHETARPHPTRICKPAATI